jgi:hypothetical protein
LAILAGKGYFDGLRFDCGTGVSESQNGLIGMELVPNPAMDRVKISLNTSFRESIQVKLFDTMGKEIYDLSVDSFHDKTTINVDISTLPSSIYLVSAIGESFNKTLKLIKQ